MAPLPDLVLYGRPGCHLCDGAREILRALLAERAAAGRPAPAIVERNIDDDSALHDRYFATIPVVEIGERSVELATSAGKLRRLLDDAFDAETAASR